MQHVTDFRIALDHAFKDYATNVLEKNSMSLSAEISDVEKEWARLINQSHDFWDTDHYHSLQGTPDDYYWEVMPPSQVPSSVSDPYRLSAFHATTP
jgi:hypothetical protein